MPPDVIWVPGGEYVRCAVNTLFMWICAAIGRWVFDMKSTYEEYYDPGFQVRKGYEGKVRKGD